MTSLTIMILGNHELNSKVLNIERRMSNITSELWCKLLAQNGKLCRLKDDVFDDVSQSFITKKINRNAEFLRELLTLTEKDQPEIETDFSKYLKETKEQTEVKKN